MSPGEEHVLLEVSGQRVALRARDVREVIRAVAVTPLAGAGPLWDGVIDYRGSMVPVLSLRARLGHERTPVAPGECFAVAVASGRLVALRAEGLVTIVTVDNSSIGSSPDGASAAPWIAGVTPHPEGLLVRYDLDAMLSADEGRAIDDALARSDAQTKP